MQTGIKVWPFGAAMTAGPRHGQLALDANGFKGSKPDKFVPLLVPEAKSK